MELVGSRSVETKSSTSWVLRSVEAVLQRVLPEIAQSYSSSAAEGFNQHAKTEAFESLILGPKQKLSRPSV